MQTETISNEIRYEQKILTKKKKILHAWQKTLYVLHYWVHTEKVQYSVNVSKISHINNVCIIYFLQHAVDFWFPDIFSTIAFIDMALRIVKFP